MSTIPASGLRLQFCADPGEFLAAAGDYLAADPVVSTVVTTVAHRMLAQQADGIAPPGCCWWLVVENAAAVAGAGMRTASFAPYPPFLLPMPDQAAVALARALHERGEEVLGLNGAVLPLTCAPPIWPGWAGAGSRSAFTRGCMNSANWCGRRRCPAACRPQPRTTWTW